MQVTVGDSFTNASDGSLRIAPLSEGYFAIIDALNRAVIVYAITTAGVVSQIDSVSIDTLVSSTSALDLSIVNTGDNHAVLYSEEESGNQSINGIRFDPVLGQATAHPGTMAADGLNQVSPRGVASTKYNHNRDTGVISREIRYNPEGYTWVGAEVAFRAGDTEPTRVGRATVSDATGVSEIPAMWLRTDGTWLVPLMIGGSETRAYELAADLTVGLHTVKSSWFPIARDGVFNYIQNQGLDGHVYGSYYVSDANADMLTLFDVVADTNDEVAEYVQGVNPIGNLTSPIKDPDGGAIPRLFRFVYNFPESGTHSFMEVVLGGEDPTHFTVNFPADDLWVYESTMLHDPILTGEIQWYAFDHDNYGEPYGSNIYMVGVQPDPLFFGTGPKTGRMSFRRIR